ncbi:MAG: hypothetical protein JWN87_3376 [Frankiales bacterium]|nr:hypothetical protein [Frankiales bacterium]
MVAERERVRPVRNTLLSVLGTAALTLDAGIRTADSSLILDLTSGQWTRCDA